MRLFDGFVVGDVLGACEMTVDPSLVGVWCRLFPDDRGSGGAPPGFAAIVTMRAYASVVTPRPPGNVHGAQRFELQRLPSLGERLTTTLTCVSKELKRERRWLGFASTTRDAVGEPCFTGQMTIAWAA